MKTSVFLDSGAHGLYTQHVMNEKHRQGYAWYKTNEFIEYLDKYAAFIKKHKDIITTYANVDVIFNPQLTWKAQQYLEKEHGLSPIPVIHHGTDFKWLQRYLAADYKYIALGGLGQEVNYREYIGWGDKAFEMICDTTTHLPSVKVHGFAMTAYELMLRYPWYSVDSTAWLLKASYGVVTIPILRKNEWRYDVAPLTVKVTMAPSKTHSQKNIDTMHTKRIRNIILQYLEEKGFSLGKTEYDKKNKKEIIIEEGISNNYLLRGQLNAQYLLDFVAHLPRWPWAFKKIERVGKLLC